MINQFMASGRGILSGDLEGLFWRSCLEGHQTSPQKRNGPCAKRTAGSSGSLEGCLLLEALKTTKYLPDPLQTLKRGTFPQSP